MKEMKEENRMFYVELRIKTKAESESHDNK